MNWNRIEGNWKQLKGKAKEQWGRLADDQFDMIAGKRDQLVGAIQKAYGVASDQAERQVKEWEKRCEPGFDNAVRRSKDRVEKIGR
jgi:uncharacterized protein YjbJ (UPF0337 family)